jgi:poly(glycerol-phosphate) alpha-glucosyltransferase
MLDAWALRFSRTKKRMVAKLFQDAQLRSAAVLHALTMAEARAIRDYGLTNPVVVIPNGVNLPATTEPAGPAPWSVQGSGRDRVLLFLSRIHPKKGLDQLLAVWPDFIRTPAGARWRLVVAGWDEIGCEAGLRALVATQGLGDSVEFTGPLFGAAKAAALGHADAFVLPSHSEGLPMAVLEAWAYGKPVLITTACNLPEGPAAGAAIEVAVSPAALAGGLKTLAEMSDASRVAMGAAGRKLIEQKFTWQRIGDDFARVYRAVAANAPLPAGLLFHEGQLFSP